MVERIDIYPTHEHDGYKLRPGRPLPFGASIVPGGVNFSVYSSNATSCTLVLFEKGAPEPMVEIPFPDEFRIGNTFSMIVFGIDVENTEYGYRMDGPASPKVFAVIQLQRRPAGCHSSALPPAKLGGKMCRRVMEESTLMQQAMRC